MLFNQLVNEFYDDETAWIVHQQTECVYIYLCFDCDLFLIVELNMMCLSSLVVELKMMCLSSLVVELKLSSFLIWVISNLICISICISI